VFSAGSFRSKIRVARNSPSSALAYAEPKHPPVPPVAVDKSLRLPGGVLETDSGSLGHRGALSQGEKPKVPNIINMMDKSAPSPCHFSL